MKPCKKCGAKDKMIEKETPNGLLVKIDCDKCGYWLEGLYPHGH